MGTDVSGGGGSSWLGELSVPRGWRARLRQDPSGMIWTTIAIAVIDTLRALLGPEGGTARLPWYDRFGVSLGVWPLALAAFVWGAALVGAVSRRHGALLLTAVTVPLLCVSAWARDGYLTRGGLVWVGVISAVVTGLYLALTFIVRPDAESLVPPNEEYAQ